MRQEQVQDIFIRAVFGKRRMMTQILSGDSLMRQDDNSPEHHHHPALPEPVRIIHKDQDSISAFCLNEVSNGLLALATPKEVQEMDISLLLESPAWFEDECEFDIVNLSKYVGPFFFYNCLLTVVLNVSGSRSWHLRLVSL